MASVKRMKTNYPGVFFIKGTSTANGKSERIYYIRYRKNGKMTEEKAGRQYQDDMTPARAALLRASRINGESLSNREVRAKNLEKNWTLNELWDFYREQKSHIKSLQTDIYRYKNYIREPLGNKKTCEITPLDIDRLTKPLYDTLKPQSIKHILIHINRIINFGVSRHLCDGLNFKIEMPKFDNCKTENLTQDQIKRLLEVLDNEPHIHAANCMKMALFTGMRKSELFRLKWDDVDFEKGFITIREPKGIIDQQIPMNNSARTVLENHPRDPHTLYVFPGEKGKQRTNFTKPVNRIKQAADLPSDFRPFHGLRHVYASTLASSGKVDMYTLQKLLTHKSPEMTQRYAHLRDETLKKATGAMDEIISNLVE